MATILNATHIEIDGARYAIEGTLNSLEEAKQLAVSQNPAYASYTAYQDGTTIKFQKPSGTKG